MKMDSPARLEELRGKWAAQKQSAGTELRVCAGTGCIANGSPEVAAALREAAGPGGPKVKMVVKRTGCHGFCEKGPLVVIEPGGIFYTKVKPADAPEIVDALVNGKGPVKRLLYRDPSTKKNVELYGDVPFYSGQTRRVLGNIGRIDPEDITEYVAAGGYSALSKVLTSMTPSQVIAEVTRSGLRGCGGAGFPTGRKWKTCADAPPGDRYIVCNGDEGDPGAFMDRSIMEGDPHAVLEGLAIGAFAVGAKTAYIYVREEYPLAVHRLKKAIAEAVEYGLLGERVLGTGFSLEVRINRGGGAFVCGESSALMRSIAGDVGEPRAKYVRSALKGLFDKPTVLNNVETLANVPLIIGRGAAWFASLGTEKSKGTKAFALVGKVKNTGLVEVPMGTTLRTIIEEIGGGIIKDRPLKAVQTGGPSGGCLPADKLDLEVDFDSLTAAGSMMGSGGMIVMDDRTCMVDFARYFTAFLVSESCGKCVPCREGLQQLLKILTGITAGRGTEQDLAEIERLGGYIKSTALCQLGVSAPNPVMSSLRYFREEYLAHIEDKRCPAGVCKDLTEFRISDEKCTGCGACVKVCPSGAISGEKKKPHAIDPGKCVKCGACRDVCPSDAIETV